MNRVETIHKEKSFIEKIMDHVNKPSISDPAPIHVFYHNHFNLVDLADRYWYKVADSHGYWNWKTKFLFAIMKYFMINVWVISIQEEYQDWITFRKNLACNLAQT
jgi:hypothetical protein